MYVPSASGSAAYRQRSSRNAAAAATSIAANVIAKRPAGRRMPDDDHSIATQPSDTGMSTKLVSFVV